MSTPVSICPLFRFESIRLHWWVTSYDEGSLLALSIFSYVRRVRFHKNKS